MTLIVANADSHGGACDVESSKMLKVNEIRRRD